jgi:hypothetical protein
MRKISQPQASFSRTAAEEIPKGIVNRHLKVLDKCNIAINGNQKWLR